MSEHMAIYAKILTSLGQMLQWKQITLVDPIIRIENLLLITSLHFLEIGASGGVVKRKELVEWEV